VVVIGVKSCALGGRGGGGVLSGADGVVLETMFRWGTGFCWERGLWG
jgi:hypothetical protein